jgi:hypothetical protein
MPNPFTLRRRSSSRINPDLESRAAEFQARARPATPPANRVRSWFTRKNRRKIVPVEDDIYGTDQIPMASVTEMARQNSNSSRNEDYPSIKEINLDDIPVTDVASEMHVPIAEVVGDEGSSCCIPGLSSLQNCRICPERLQPPTPPPAEFLTPQKEIGGKKRRKASKRSKKRQLKKRHYTRRRNRL